MRARVTRTHLCRIRTCAALLGAAALTFAGCGGGNGSSGGPGPERGSGGSAYAHVHGLGINPGDSALFIATHEGLYRVAEGSRKASQVGESRQDVMGFTIVGRDRFLASGHPGQGQNGPPNLGLISSSNGGATWTPVSLLGEADFHVLRFAGGRLYGFDGPNGRLMVSRDRGRSWHQETPPGGVVDLAPDPQDSSHIIASTERGIAESKNAGKSWRILDASRIGLLVWPSSRELFLVDGRGQIHRSADAGRSWRPVSTIGGQPAAFAWAEKSLYAARADAAVLASHNGGRSWQVRVQP